MKNKSQSIGIILSLTALTPMLNATDATWSGGTPPYLTTGANWIGGSVPTGIATFDSNSTSYFSPTASEEFSIDNFNFTNSASDFSFTFTGPGFLAFTGEGITGTNTNTQINMTNATSISTPQMIFNPVNTPSTAYIGSASFSITNTSAGTITYGYDSEQNAGQFILADSDLTLIEFISTVPVVGGDGVTINVINNGTITNSANEAAQIFLKGSSFTVGNNLIINTFNSGSGANITSRSDTGHIVFDAGDSTANFTTGDDATFTFTNENAASIQSSLSGGNNAGQLIFDASYGIAKFTLGNSASFTLINSGNSSITNPSSANDAAQILFDGDTGTASFSAGNNTTFILKNQDSLIQGLGMDSGQMVFDADKGIVSFTVGNFLSINIDNDSTSSIESGSVGHDSGQMLFDGNQGTSSFNVGDSANITITNEGSITSYYNTGQLIVDGYIGAASFNIGNNTTINATNSGSIINSSAGSLAAQILFNGSSALSLEVSLTTGENVTITAINANGAVISNTDASPAAQMYFRNTTINGNPTLSAINQSPSIGSIEGIVFDGPSTANSSNIVLSNTSLIVNTTNPLTIGSLTGDSSSVVKLSNNLEINTAFGATSTFAGSISDTSGSNNLSIGGSGVQILSGPNAFTGTTTINGGKLVLAGSVTSNVIVNAGTLSGTGTITGNLTVNLPGTVSPGSSSGILNVAGDATFNSGSTFNIDCDANGVSQLITTGIVNIDSGSTISITTLPGFILNQAKDTYIIESTGLSGIFSTVIKSAPLINATLEYFATDLLLKFNLAQFETIGLIGNPLAVGVALDEIVASESPALNGVISTLLPLTTNEISYALNQMQPALFKGLTISQENNAVKVQNSLGIRMQNEMDRKSCYSLVTDQKDSSKKVPCSKDENRIHIWADGFGDLLRQKSNFYAESFQIGYQNKTGGIVAGLDGRFADCLYLGALGGYTGSDIHWMNGHGKGDIDTGYGGLYFSALGKMFYANASVIGGFSHFHAQRTIIYPGMDATATNNHGGSQLLSHLDTGVNLGFHGLTVRPFDSFDYISQSEGSYTETGAGALNLHVKSNNAILLRNELGLQFAGCFCVGSSNWTLSPKISWVREVRVKGSQYTSEFTNTNVLFDVTGYFPDRSLVSPGVMVSGMLWKDRLGLDLYYDGEFGQKYSDHNYGGQIRFGF